LIFFCAIPGICFATYFSVTIDNIKNGKGSLIVTLYTPEIRSAFPAHPEKALEKSNVPIEGERQTIVFKNLNDGNYEISTVHDENGNGKMDSNFLGLPKEGFGFSNNPTLLRGGPEFEAVSVPVSLSNQRIAIQLHYW